MIVRSVLREALAARRWSAALLGLGLGVVLALGLVELMRDGLDFPVGEPRLRRRCAPIAAVATAC